MLFVGAANGIISFWQFSISPEELSGWGPGYEERLSGEGDVAARTFENDSGDEQARPFGLGSDSGTGGIVGLLSLPRRSPSSP